MNTSVSLSNVTCFHQNLPSVQQRINQEELFKKELDETIKEIIKIIVSIHYLIFEGKKKDLNLKGFIDIPSKIILLDSLDKRSRGFSEKIHHLALEKIKKTSLPFLPANMILHTIIFDRECCCLDSKELKAITAEPINELRKKWDLIDVSFVDRFNSFLLISRL